MSETTTEATLPKAVQQGLDQFCSKLQEALGDQLVSIVLYGGLARGEYAPKNSDVNVLVVLKEVDVDVLDRVAPHVRRGARKHRLSVLLLSEKNLRTSTDVFPIKFQDMQRHYRVLSGKDVITDIKIAREHLRLRCEQEIKNLLLRLCQFYLHSAHSSGLIENTLTRAISSFLTDLNVLVELKTGQVSNNKSSIVDEVEKIGLDGGPLRNALALKQGEMKVKGAELKRLYGEFMGTVQQAAEMVNEMGR